MALSRRPQRRSEIAHLLSWLRFSLSHTRGLAACPLILNRAIGVDVEDISRDLSTGVRRFLEYWTLKEAYVAAGRRPMVVMVVPDWEHPPGGAGDRMKNVTTE